jgi:hypothetical protein
LKHKERSIWKSTYCFYFLKRGGRLPAIDAGHITCVRR